LLKSSPVTNETVRLIQGHLKMTLVILAFAQVDLKSIRVFYPQGS
jgi:hypothetical protein